MDSGSCEYAPSFVLYTTSLPTVFQSPSVIILLTWTLITSSSGLDFPGYTANER